MTRMNGGGRLSTLSLRSYIKKEVTELLELKPSTIEVYVDKGLVTPEVDNPGGKGTRRRYSPGNLFEFLLIQKLVLYGLSLAKIKSVLEKLRTDDHLDANGWKDSDVTFLVIYTTESKADEPLIEPVIGTPQDRGIGLVIPRDADGALIVRLSDVCEKLSKID